MPTPSQSCPDCGRGMTYDPILSKKGKKILTFWCLECSHIIVESRFDVSDAVQSVRRFIFHGHLP